MKNRKSLIAGIAIVVFALALLCATAAASLPSTKLTGDNLNTVNVTYSDATLIGDTLQLAVNYEGNGGQYEIARDIRVSRDASFSDVLECTECTANNGTYVYSFACEDADLSQVYVEAPVMYVNETVQPFTMSLASDAAVTSDDWLSVSDLSIEDWEDGAYAVSVEIDIHTDTLPRDPKLVIGGERLGATSALTFNEDGKCIYGVFTFYVDAPSKAELAAQLENTNIVVQNALEKVEYNVPSAMTAAQSSAVVVPVTVG